MADCCSSCRDGEVCAAAHAPGGDYTAVRASDGTYAILDVPVYVERYFKPEIGSKGMVLPAVDHDGAFLRKCIARAQYREKFDRFLAPLHLIHHDTGEAVVYAGKFRAKEVRETMYEGRRTATVFADLIEIPAAIYAEVKAKLWPGRSVEFLNRYDPEINSLALLNHDVPWARLPALSVGREIAEKGSIQKSVAPRTNAVALASARTDAAARVTVRFPNVEAAAMAKAKTAVPEAPASIPPVAPPVAPAVAAAPPFPKKDDEEAPKEEGEKKTPAANAEATPPEAPPAPAAEPVEAPPEEAADGDDSALANIVSMLQMLMTALGIAPPSQKPAGPGNPVDAPNGVQAPGLSRAAPVVEDPAAAARAKADADELAALRGEKAAHARAQGIQAVVAAAEADLKGVNLSDADHAEIRRLAETGGEASVKAYAAAVKTHAPQDPPRSLEAARLATETEPPEVAAYAKQGPAVHEAARMLSRSFAEVGKYTPGLTLTKFISSNLASAARARKEAEGDAAASKEGS